MVTLHRWDALPSSESSELAGALHLNWVSVADCGLCDTRLVPCFAGVSEPGAEICVSVFCLRVEDSVLCHVLCHFCAVTHLGNLLQQGVLRASWKGKKIQISLMHTDFRQHCKMINGVECATELGTEKL